MKFIKHHSTTTAILLFARSENSESVLKPIACQKKQNLLLWKKMNEGVLKTIQKTNLPYFISDETTQVGTSFGKKITHSIEAVFAQGFDKVIVVGNDCLELQSKHLLEASDKLKTNNLVLGADYHGGTYLIGISKSVFEADKFEAISWQTTNVYIELQMLFSQKDVHCLPFLTDCNSSSDFNKAIYKLSFSNPLRNLIFSLLQYERAFNQFNFFLVSYGFSTLNFNKGSPFSC
jgi:uncharacterized protein